MGLNSDGFPLHDRGPAHQVSEYPVFGAHAATWSVSGLSKRFGGTQALDSVNLTFPSGSITGLLGENGAGKSTLLSLLGGMTTPNSGSILKNGTPVEFRTPRDARSAGIAVVSQEPDVIEALSIAENIFLGQMPNRYGFARQKEVTRRADELVKTLGIAILSDTARPAREVSAAGRQLIEILRAYVVRPGLLALDEPTTALDTEQVDALVLLVERLQTEGTAVIYVTHRLAELERVASRVVVLRDGKLIAVHEERLIREQVENVLGEMTGKAFDSVERKQRHINSEIAISAENVSTAKLRSVSVEVRRGEILGIAGLAGSGRTELAKTLAGLIRLHSGTLTVEGKSMGGGGRFNPARSGVVYISEDRHDEGLLMSRSIRENISIGSLHLVQSMSFLRRKREVALAKREVMNLSIKCSSIEMPVSALSGGNQQKVVIARALAVGARIWILDDPTKGVDIGAKNAIYQLLEERVTLGDAVVFVSSEIQELLTLSDRIVVMRGGEISSIFEAVGTTEEMMLSSMFHVVSK